MYVLCVCIVKTKLSQIQHTTHLAIHNEFIWGLCILHTCVPFRHMHAYKYLSVSNSTKCANSAHKKCAKFCDKKMAHLFLLCIPLDLLIVLHRFPVVSAILLSIIH